MITFDRADFRKSTFSDDDKNNCVEVALVKGAEVVGIGDSKAPFGGYLRFSHAAFAALRETVVTS